MSEVATDKRTVRLSRVRLSFTDGLKDKQRPKGVADGKEKHSVNILVETGQPEFEANNKAIVAAIREACDQEWKNAEKWKEIAEDNPKRLCYRKGERFKNKEGQVYEGYAGNWALSCSGPRGGHDRPTMLDRHKREVEEKDILDVCYGGSYADVIVSFYGTEKGGLGVFCSVEVIRSRQEGDRMGGAVHYTAEKAADLFDDLGDEDPFGDGGGDGDTGSAGDDAFIG